MSDFWITAYFVFGVFVAGPLAAGMIFAMFQGAFPMLARRDFRGDLGMSVWVGMMTAAIWPVLLPMIWLISGFAEHGVWIVRKSAEAEPLQERR